MSLDFTLTPGELYLKIITMTCYYSSTFVLKWAHLARKIKDKNSLCKERISRGYIESNLTSLCLGKFIVITGCHHPSAIMKLANLPKQQLQQLQMWFYRRNHHPLKNRTDYFEPSKLSLNDPDIMSEVIQQMDCHFPHQPVMKPNWFAPVQMNQ